MHSTFHNVVYTVSCRVIYDLGLIKGGGRKIFLYVYVKQLMLAIAGSTVVSWPCPLAKYPPVCPSLWPPAGLKREPEKRGKKEQNSDSRLNVKKWGKKEKNKRCKHTQSQTWCQQTNT